MHLHFFALDEDVEQLEALVARTPQDVLPLIHLAWALRQRNSQRAVELADQVQVLLAQPQAALSEEDVKSSLLRLDLIRGEVKWLMGELDQAKALAEQALQGFAAQQDGWVTRSETNSDRNVAHLGSADAHWLRSWIAHDQGDLPATHAALQAMTVVSTDPVRICVAEAALARSEALLDLRYARERWGEHFAETGLHPAAACWLQDFLGMLAALGGDEVPAIRYWSQSHTLALASGQQRRAIVSAANIGDRFNNLHEYHSALEWQQRALQLARHCGWPSMTGMALNTCGNTLRQLQKLALAGEMLNEAQVLMFNIAGSRSYAIALQYLAELELDRKDYTKALAAFQQLETRVRALQQTDLISSAMCGQADALNQLGQALPAQQAAMAALVQATSITVEKIPALRALAAIHSRHSLPLASDAPDSNSTFTLTPGEDALQLPDPLTMLLAGQADTPPSAALYYLQQALDLAAGVENYIVPPELFEDIATEYARLGQHERAWDFSRQAIQALRDRHNQQTADRSLALQAAHESEKATRALEESQRIAQEETRRAALLQQANDTLQTLGSIGQQITAHLDRKKVFAVLEAHLQGLLAFDSIAVYLLDQERSHLQVVYCVERGTPMPLLEIPLSDPHSNSVRCLREEREIMLEFDPVQDDPTQIPGSLVSLSRLFAPLRANDQAFGVLSIQSTRQHAYGTREQMIFRTLCAYTAIAISNCDAHNQMQESQRQLIQQEKMASLGQLIANVAHEINTPIGAMNASSETIQHALEQAFAEVPKFAPKLSREEYHLFNQLIGHSKERGPLPSTREERAMVRACTEQLEQAGIHNARHVASVLVQLDAQAHLHTYLPLLTLPDAEQILRAANHVGMLFTSTNAIRQAVGGVSKIIFALKSFTHASQSDELEPAQLRNGIDTVLTIYHNQIKKGTELILNDEGIPPVPCLQDELNQVWVNLIHNALQAMDYKGTLTISLRQQGDDAVVAVTDTGCGIAPEHLNKIFDPFFTTKPSGEGSGLGLDITRKIVAKHKGRIEVASTVGVGTTFAVYLPMQQPG